MVLEKFLKGHHELKGRGEELISMTKEVVYNLERWLEKDENYLFQYIQWVENFFECFKFSSLFFQDLIKSLREENKDNQEILARIAFVEQELRKKKHAKVKSNNKFGKMGFNPPHNLFPLAHKIVLFHKEFCPQFGGAYEFFKRDLVDDCTNHLNYFKEAILMDSEKLFLHYVKWMKSLFSSRGIERKSLIYFLVSITNVLAKEPVSLFNKDFRLWYKAIQSLLNDEERHHDLKKDVLNSDARQYLAYLLKGKRKAASDFILEKYHNGMSIKKIYIDIFKPVQYQLGVLWENNDISEAKEHFCTATTQLVMAQLYPHIFKGNYTGKKVVATCVNNELHEIGIRMVADLLELDGWDTYFVGANVPASGVVSTIKEQKAEIVAVSVTIIPHLHELRNLIQLIRKECKNPVRIIVGGNPFIIDEELWRKVGADGFANSADKINDVALKLVA